MEIESFKKKKDNKYEVIFKDSSSIDLYDDVIIKYNLLANKKIDLSLFDEITKYNDSLDAYYVSLKYINKKIRTKLEIEKYLEKKEFDNNIIKDTISKLEKNKVLDENLYIKAYVNDQINFSMIGPHKIANKLYLLGIDKNDSYDYINSIDNNIWLAKIKKIIDKRIKTNKTYSTVMLKNKIVTFLINEGYDKEIVYDVLNNYSFDTDIRIIKKEYEKVKTKLSKKYDGNNLEFQINMKLKSKGFTSDEIKKLSK